jgi:hypothetical protein
MPPAADDPPGMRRQLLWAAVLLGSTLSLAVSWSIASQSLVLGSLEWGWKYDYVDDFSRRPLGAALIVTGAASALLLAIRPAAGMREWVGVALWILTATGLHALLRSLTPFALEDIFRSDAANSFFSVAQTFDPRFVLSDFAEVRARWPLHAQSNMPGKLMLTYALRLVSERPEVLAWLVVLLSNAGGALLYLFVRDLFGDRRVALYSLVLYLFVPARLVFFPLMNTVTPVVFLACACLLLRWLQTGRARYAAALGAALYFQVFFEPLPLVMGLLFAVLIAGTMARREIAPTLLVRQMGVGLIGFAVAWLAVYLWFGFDLLAAFRLVGAHAVEFNVANARPYGVWVRENLREFAFGMGVCQAVLFFAAVADGYFVRARAAERSSPILPLCLALAAILVTTDLIGVNRAEVMRLWIFLACFFQIPAAWVCARLGAPAAVLVVAVTAVQGALGTAMIGFVLAG